MAIPTTETADGKTYDFVPDKTVAVGDPTEAVADHDTLAENSDYDRAQAVAGWAASECGADNLRTVKNGTGELFFCGTATIQSGSYKNGFDLNLHDRGSQEVPADADLRSRFIRIDGTIILTDHANQSRTTFMPGSGTNDVAWGTEGLSGLLGAMKFDVGGKFFSGPGEIADLNSSPGGLKYYLAVPIQDDSNPPTYAPSFTIYFFIDSANYKVRAVVYETDLVNYDGMAMELRLSYGPQWITP